MLSARYRDVPGPMILGKAEFAAVPFLDGGRKPPLRG
jgi:hypothetical protein